MCLELAPRIADVKVGLKLRNVIVIGLKEATRLWFFWLLVLCAYSKTSVSTGHLFPALPWMPETADIVNPTYTYCWDILFIIFKQPLNETGGN